MIYQQEYDTMLSICRQITTHRQVLAKPRLEELILNRVDPQTVNAELLSHLIAESLLRRIDKQLLESKNIFVQDFDVPQTSLFYSMAEAVPFVYAGHTAANACLQRAAEGLRTFALLDIGIGNGAQVTRLLKALAAAGTALKAVTVIGLDPVEKNVNDATAALEALKPFLTFEVTFHPICGMIEALKASDWDSLAASGENLLINSAFTFHHTAHPLHDQETRTTILKKLAALKPRLLTLVEPSSNHDTEDLGRRIHSSWEHFGNVFALVDESAIEASHKFIIKSKFFGREIRDIFGTADHFRCERHEPYDSWLLRMFKAGYQPLPLPEVALQLPSYCRYTVTEGLVRMDYRDTTIVAVMAFSLKA